MSWTAVRPYFDSILAEKGYQEWSDGFAVDNIPANLLDYSFHVSIPTITGVRQNQSDQETEVEVTVRTFYKGYSNPQGAIDTAISETEAIMQECVKPLNRTVTAGILNVSFNQATIDPIGATNDNAVVVTADYTVRVVIAV